MESVTQVFVVVWNVNGTPYAFIKFSRDDAENLARALGEDDCQILFDYVRNSETDDALGL